MPAIAQRSNKPIKKPSTCIDGFFIGFIRNSQPYNNCKPNITSLKEAHHLPLLL